MAQQTAVELLLERICIDILGDEYINKLSFEKTQLFREISTQAKQMEKDKEKQKLIGFLDWMNKVAADNPMAFETDHDDIVEMYLNGFYGK